MDKDILQLIYKEIQEMKADINGMKADMEKMQNSIDMLSLKQDKTQNKLDDLSLDVKISERNIRKDIETLKDETETVIEILKINKLVS